MEWIFYVVGGIIAAVFIGIIVAMIRAKMRGESLTQGPYQQQGTMMGSGIDTHSINTGSGDGGGGGSN